MDFQNKRIAILGFGREGQSTLRFLLSENVTLSNITILDQNTGAVIPEGVLSVLGESYLGNLSVYDMLIVTPGQSPYVPEIQEYKKGTGIVTSQTDIFFKRFQGKVIGVTATKGKSTTVTLIYQSLLAWGKDVKLVGNIGTPVLDSIDWKHPPEWVVYELSSYMLEYSHPNLEIAVLGNIYPDHLDYHAGFENYRNAKLRILQNAKHRVVGKLLIELIAELLSGTENSSSLTVDLLGSAKDFQSLLHSEKDKSSTWIIPDLHWYHLQWEDLYNGSALLMKGSEISLLGEHNKRNILSVFAVTSLAGIPDSVTREAVSNFRGLPHRLEFVGEFQGIRFYDDAISTTPESTMEGIRSFNGNVSTIFLGGLDRGYDFAWLVQELRTQNIWNIVLFPDSGLRILPLLDQSFRILSTSSMEEAVRFAYKYTQKGEICLLSTASPSYNLWKNYEAKGDEFQKYVWDGMNV